MVCDTTLNPRRELRRDRGYVVRQRLLFPDGYAREWGLFICAEVTAMGSMQGLVCFRIGVLQFHWALHDAIIRLSSPATDSSLPLLNRSDNTDSRQIG